MKTMISDNKGFKTYVSISEVLKPEGFSQLEFSTVWENAKHPETEQTKFRLVLSLDQIKSLKDFL